MDISPRYLANIENKGQQPSLQIFYELVTRYDISVDQYFFPDKSADKSTMRRQLDTLLDGMSDKGLHIVTETAKAVVKVEKENENWTETRQTYFWVCRAFFMFFLRLFGRIAFRLVYIDRGDKVS